MRIFVLVFLHWEHILDIYQSTVNFHFLVSVASVPHWFTGTSYTEFPGQTNGSVKTMF